MAKLKNWKCYEYQVNSIKKAEGQLIYTTDTGKIFLDIDSNTRIQVNSIYKITSSEMATINPITDGTYYITDTKMFYFYDGSNWIKFGGSFTGSQTTESSADGGSNVYTFSDGSTITVKNGSKGSTGATGTRGSVINEGTAITGTSTTAKVFSGSGLTSSLVNDLYINTSTFNIYRCTVAGNAATAKWVYVGCIKGAKGDTGDKGEKGATGEQGPQGIQGEQGPKGDNGDLIHIGSTFASSTQKKIFFRTV